MTDILNPLQILALSKLTKENAVKAVRKEVKPGSYPAAIEIRVNVNGEAKHVLFEGPLTVGEDGSQRPTSNLFSMEVMALLFQRMGIQRERALETLREVATEYLNKGQSVGDGVKDLVKDFEGFADEYGKMLESLPRIPKSGSVSLQAECVEVQEADVPQAKPRKSSRVRAV